MIAIHKGTNDFSSRWIEYCRTNRIDYKIVDCYSTNIIRDLSDCDALMWHFNHTHPKDTLFAKQLLYALQSAGLPVFPDFYTSWHFDDKVGQKYLLEAIGAPMVPSFVFYDKKEALQWIGVTEFPKVFKLRGGGGSAHVKLVKNRSAAKKLINKAFGRGFSQYDRVANLKDRWYKYRKGNSGFWNVVKGVIRFAKTTKYARIAGPERGYVYFQDFIPYNDFDIRVIVIDDKAFAIKRLVREGDFRASGSGHIQYEQHLFDEETIRLSFEVATEIKSQCLAIDYVYQDSRPLIVELSYGFVPEAYSGCVGYWDRDLNWHEGSFDPTNWMVDVLLTGKLASVGD